MLGFQAVFLLPILAEDNSCSRKLSIYGALNENSFPFLGTGSTEEQDWSLVVTWREGTGIPQASVSGCRVANPTAWEGWKSLLSWGLQGEV